MGVVSTAETGAFRALYASQQGRIRGLLSRLAGPQDAEDLTQVTYMKAAQALPDFRGDAELSSWLHRLAVNVALDWLRSRVRHEAKRNDPLPEPPDEAAAALESPKSPEQAAAEKDTNACCPMHRDVRQTSPGKCPKCGMALLPEGTRFAMLRHMTGSPLHLAVMAAAMLALMAAAMMLMR